MSITLLYISREEKNVKREISRQVRHNEILLHLISTVAQSSEAIRSADMS